MVTFTNIRIENGYIYATALDESTGFTEDIIAKLDGSYHSSSDYTIIKATWNVVIEYKKYKKIPKEMQIVWG